MANDSENFTHKSISFFYFLIMVVELRIKIKKILTLEISFSFYILVYLKFYSEMHLRAFNMFYLPTIACLLWCF